MGRDLAATSRREFLIRGAFVGGALLVGPAAAARGAAAPEFGAFGPFLKVAADGTVVVICKHSELGQGAHTGLAVIVAEELDADWRRVRVEMAPADPRVYGHTRLKLQITGGSSTIANSWDQLRKAGAAARGMFVQAAARRWRVPASEIDVADSVLRHAKSGRSAGFGELLAEAASAPPATDPPLKRPESFKLIGSETLTRLDASAKSAGAPIYTQDVDLPGQLTAVVSRPPRFGAKVKTFDAAAVRRAPGVVEVFEIPTGVAVVASSTWAALKGRDLLKVVWDETGAEKRSSAEILADYKRLAVAEAPAGWVRFERRGDVDKAFADPGEVVTLTYDFPYLAHAAMEPMNCVAQVKGTSVRLTYGAQNHTTDQKNIAALVGGRPEEVEIVTVPAGGSFGRRSVGVSDYQRECVEIARRIGGFRPVKLMWTRDDDFRAGYYRPLTHHRIDVKLDESGYPAAWRHRLVSASLLAGTPFGAALPNGIDPTVIEGVQGSPYLAATPVVEASALSPKSVVPVCWLRSVGATHAAMAMEHTIDQLARRAKVDPVAYRRTLYVKAGAARHLRALDLAVEKSSWGTPLPEGWARGVAVHECFGSVVANVVEATLSEGEPKVRRVVAVVDCGLAVTPDIVRAQMEGGVCYGLSYDLYGELKLEGGAVGTTNFDSYRVLRFHEAPVVETYIVPSADPPTGVGEPGTPVIGPALANALLALTGRPTESLPLARA